MRTLVKLLVLACLLAYLSGVPIIHVILAEAARILGPVSGWV